MLKEARRKAGVHRDVALHHCHGSPWYSVSNGPISVHCMGAEIREEIALEELAPSEAAITWWRQEERRLTLRDMRVHSESESELSWRS